MPMLVLQIRELSQKNHQLNFRALNIRQAHERPEAMEEASVMMVGYPLNVLFYKG